MSNGNIANIGQHTVKGSAYSIFASAITLSLGVVRATLMARLLLPEIVGLGALGLLFMDMAAQIGVIGLHSAFIHRKEDDESLQTTYFTLNLILTGGSLLVLGLFLPLIVRYYPDYPHLGEVILAYMGIELIKAMSTPATMVLSKKLAFGQIAVLDVMGALSMTIVGPGMAWKGFGVWSIVGEHFIGVFMRFVMVLFVFRAWRPRFGWDWNIVRWFWAYGTKAWWSTNLTFVLANFDEFWIGLYSPLRVTALGLYAKAYDYATYSRKVIANPLLSVFFPTYAHLQSDRLRLSRTFFRATSLMVRAGCLFSLVFILTAPEFIHLFLGEQWLPMLATFQLMIVYTLLDPLTLAAQSLMMATGHPGAVLRARMIQTVIFIPAVILLSIVAGIEGVALATDLMIVVGTVLLFRDTYRVTDYSSRALWAWPLVAMGVTGAIVFGMTPFWATIDLWLVFISKLLLIPLLYGGLLLAMEREQLLAGWNMVWEMVRPKLKNV